MKLKDIIDIENVTPAKAISPVSNRLYASVI